MDGVVTGRVVQFVFTQEQADEVMRRRTTGASIADRMKLEVDRLNHERDEGVHAFAWPAGAQAHIGNPVTAGSICPAMIVAVNGTNGNSNLKVMLDGTDVYWAISRDYDAAKTPGTWHWPERV